MSAVTVLFDGEIQVHYGFLFLQPMDETPDLDGSRGGQANGLCGAAQPGVLSMITGLHTGSVPVRVESLDGAPVLEPDWEEAVEASYETAETALLLQAFDDGTEIALPAPGSYRVRWCAAGMDAARDGDVRMEDEPALDRYRLQLWPAPPAPDAILRQTSEIAAYWHGVARDTPPPPPPPTAAELAEAERREAERRQDQERQWHEDVERQAWGGRLPSDRLRAIGGRAAQLAAADRELVEEVAALDPAEQRAIAAWAARWACTAAGLADADWVAPALAALDRGDPLPAPFDAAETAWTALHPPGTTVVTFSILTPATAGPPALAPEAAAVDAVLCAGAGDPARAAVDALSVVHGRADLTGFMTGRRWR